MKDYVGQAIMMIFVSNGCQGDLSREKGEGLRNIQNTGRWNYSALASSQVSIYWLGFHVLILLPSLWIYQSDGQMS